MIGDPGDPEKGEDLPGARAEALTVKETLESTPDVVVESRIGAPGGSRDGDLYDVKPADRLEVLSLLLRGDFDLVHYAGHANFDPARPDRVGWVFARGLLTPGEIGRLERVPAIIVSNACLSARTSLALDGGRRPDESRTEAGLLPSLADEFFKLGVRNYVGTAWEVNDVGAELFARVLYTGLLAGTPFGEAVRSGARDALARPRDLRLALGGLPALRRSHGDARARAQANGRADGRRRVTDEELLRRYNPYLQYDSLESFRADSAATIPEHFLEDGPKWSYANVLKRKGGARRRVRTADGRRRSS